VSVSVDTIFCITSKNFINPVYGKTVVQKKKLRFSQNIPSNFDRILFVRFTDYSLLTKTILVIKCCFLDANMWTICNES